jgi:hypothetical protein
VPEYIRTLDSTAAEDEYVSGAEYTELEAKKQYECLGTSFPENERCKHLSAYQSLAPHHNVSDVSIEWEM